MLRNRFVQVGLLGLIILFIIWKVALRRPAPKPPPQKGKIVFVAKRDIRPGEFITPFAVQQKRVSKPPANAVSDPTELQGRVARTFIRKGQIILLSHLGLLEEVAGLSARIPGAMRAIALEVTENEAPEIKDLKKDDTVDIVAIYEDGETPYSRTIAQGIQVIDIERIRPPQQQQQRRRGQAGARAQQQQQPPRPARYRLVLAVNPDQAERIVLAQATARLRFAIRARLLPPPSTEQLPKGWDVKTLFQGAFPRPPKPKEERKPKPVVKKVSPPPPPPPPVMEPKITISPETVRR